MGAADSVDFGAKFMCVYYKPKVKCPPFKTASNKGAVIVNFKAKCITHR